MARALVLGDAERNLNSNFYYLSEKTRTISRIIVESVTKMVIFRRLTNVIILYILFQK